MLGLIFDGGPHDNFEQILRIKIINGWSSFSALKRRSH